MGATKNRLDRSTIERMAAKYFGKNYITETVELTEGLCNAAYLVTLADGTELVLKIALQFQRNTMSNEIGMMDAEVQAMQLVAEQTDVSVAKVYGYDTSCSICTSPYFFMEKLTGRSYFSCKQELSEQTIQQIDRETGIIERKVSGIRGDRFGLLGDPAHWTDTLFGTVKLMLTRVLSDAAVKNVPLGVSGDELLTLLQEQQSCFDEVTEPPVLVHWDMWDGNIFIKEGHVSGIIDWERALWGEAFMDDRFRRHTRTTAFLKGYGQDEFTDNERIRLLWYDVFLYLTMMTEGAYREYEDDSQYNWVKPLFEDSWYELKQEKIKKQFAAYTAAYDMTDDKICLKAEHTYRVAQLCEQIAESLNLSREDIFLAWTCGMLHDVGRFEQLRQFGTFKDAISIDHAHFGVHILFDEKQIRDYLDTDRYDELLANAVFYHSAYRLPENLDERTRMFCQILRDADKIDILRVNVEFAPEIVYNSPAEVIRRESISPEAMADFARGHAVNHTHKKNAIDYLAGHASLVFELVYSESRRLVQEQGYLAKLLDFRSENPATMEQLQVMKEQLDRLF